MKRRRTKGDGTIYLKGRFWWIAYQHPDGTRRSESTGTERRQVAERLLRKRLGAAEHNLPVIPRAEQLTFTEAAQAVVDDFVANKKRSEKVVRRRIRLHLMPYFGGRRLVGITSADVTRYVAKRQTDAIVTRKARVMTRADGTTHEIAEQRKPVSPAEINRELQVLKRIFSLAIESGRIASKPSIKMLREAPPRSGFFEPEQIECVIEHLSDELRPVIVFAYLTGWRIASEILPLEWRQVDFAAREIRLDAGTTKNGAGRVFPFTEGDPLAQVLRAQQAVHRERARAGHLSPRVFVRMVAEGRGGDKKPRPIVSLNKAWKAACRAAGLPGRIPHDLRRTAVRNLVRAGVSEHSAMELTGHKTRSVFDRYDIVSGTDLREAAGKLHSAQRTPQLQATASGEMR
jgi:integrase